MLSFIMFFCLLVQAVIFRIDADFTPNYKIPAIVCQVVFFYIMFTPVNHFHRHSRWALIKACGQIVIAPFGLVKFRHFFFCNVLTTTNDIMYDFADTICFYQNSCFRGIVPFKCRYATYVMYAWSVIPYYWRMC